MTERTLRGSAAIARALGVSQKTVQRRARAGQLPVCKEANHTSPWVIHRGDLERLKRARLLDAE